MGRQSNLTEKYKTLLRNNIGPDGRPVRSWNRLAAENKFVPRTVRRWVEALIASGDLTTEALKSSAESQALAKKTGPKTNRAKSYESLLEKLAHLTETGSDSAKLAAIKALIEETRLAGDTVGPPPPSTPDDYITYLRQIFKYAPSDALRTAWELHNAAKAPENSQNAGLGGQTPDG